MTIAVISRWDVTPLRGYFRRTKKDQIDLDKQKDSCNVLTDNKKLDKCLTSAILRNFCLPKK